MLKIFGLIVIIVAIFVGFAVEDVFLYRKCKEDDNSDFQCEVIIKQNQHLRVISIFGH